MASDASHTGAAWDANGSRMGGLLQDHDWSGTSLGPIETWPGSLTVAVGIMLGAQTPMGIYWGRDLVLLYNDAWAAVIGKKHPLALGKPAQQVFPELWDTIGPVLTGVLAGKGAAEARDQLLPFSRNGRIEDAWFTYSCTPIPGESGPPAGILTMLIETTEEHRASLALLESEAQLRALVEASSYVIYRTSPDWSEMRRLFGRGIVHDTQHPSGTWMQEYVHPDDRARVRDAIQSAIRAKSVYELEHRILRADGTTGWTLSRAVPILDARGEIVEWFGTASDITARRQTEEALRASEARLAAIFARAAVGLSEIAPDGRFLQVNDELCHILGRPRKDLLNLSIADVTQSDDVGPSLAAARQVLETGQSVSLDKRYRRPDGNEVCANSILTRLDGEQGPSLLAVTVDLTARHAAKAALRAARDEADHARRAAEEANQAKSRFLAAASHDLRQPVMAAGLYLGLLESRVRDPEAGDLVDMVSLSLDGLRTMLNGLLETARLEAGVVEPRVEAFALDDLLYRLGAEFEGLARAAKLWFQVPPTDLVVHSDRLLLELILRNLISNAVKYTERGGVAVECARAEDCVRISVIDTGPGIPAESQERVFEDFVRVGETNRSLGFGLGLPTVRRAAALLGHRVDVRSEPGKGSTFSVWVPDGEKAPPASAASPPSADLPLPACAVLVVEDDQMVAAGLRMALEDWGLDVTLAHSVAEARAAAADQRFDLVISDFQLPDGDGFGAIPASCSGTAGRTVLLTGDTRPETLRRAHEAGFCLLTKPVDIRALREAVRRIVGTDMGQG
ncbi:PAS domain S-box protein [Indioceanicola profundi]|uniref:PAS domain S-box protein n=1 Tax=Indioceanicola profundi TaxID=2220096 RepID=UPI000E6A96EF|nr:PAS domain S-box protein [Indioceanicola profundi]